MSASAPVPADDDAGSLFDLVEDCREVSGVLAPYVPGEIRLPEARPAEPLQIDPAVVAGIAGWPDYGS